MPEPLPVPDRRYPARPVIGVGAAIVNDDDRVVLVCRAQPPLAGAWSLPGGAVEVGESLGVALAREVLEETGLLVEVGPLVDVFEFIDGDPDGRVSYHYVLLDYLCRPVGGELTAGTDASAAMWVGLSDLAGHAVTAEATQVLYRAVQMRRDVWS